MSLNIKLAKKINGKLQILNLQTQADAVVYDESLNVKDTLDALVEAVDNLESSLYLDTIYITTSDGEIITDDGGTGAVAVASLTAVDLSSSSGS